MKNYAEWSEAKKFWNLKNKHTFYFNNHSKIFSLCLKMFPCVTAKFPVFSLFGKSKNQIPCFPCAVATLNLLRELLRWAFCSDSCYVPSWLLLWGHPELQAWGVSLSRWVMSTAYLIQRYSQSHRLSHSCKVIKVVICDLKYHLSNHKQHANWPTSPGIRKSNHTYVCVGKSKNIMSELKFYDSDLRFHVPTHGGWKVISMLLVVW